MKFDKHNEAESMMEGKAKQEAQKAAGKAAKKAGNKLGQTKAGQAAKGATKKAAAKGAQAAAKGAQAAAKLMTQLILWLGPPGCIALVVIIIVIALMQSLPAGIVAIMFGTDAAYSSEELTTETSTTASLWETSAEDSINARYSQLVTQNFWDDLTSFFTTGSWGEDSLTFKTEFATASDVSDDGEETSTQYFSSSNRIIAILNEMFKSSLEDISKDGVLFFRNEVLVSAENGAKAEMDVLAAETQTIADSEVSELKTTLSNYTVRLEEEILTEVVIDDPVQEDLEDVQFVSESAYILAASSTSASVTDAEFGNESDSAYATYVKDLLDISFYMTRADSWYKGTGILTTNETCWESTWITWVENASSSVTSTYSEKNGLQKPVYDYNDDGTVKTDEDGYYVVLDWEDDYRTVTKTTTTITYTVKGTYTIQLKSNFKEIVNEYFQLEETEDIDESYQMSMIDQVTESSVQLMKFYYEQMSVSVLGLPIEAGAYTIGDPFNCTCSVHNGSHNGQDLKAATGTGLFAIADGTVTAIVTGMSNTYPNTNADGTKSYGNYVVITHEDGSTSKYCHMNDVFVSLDQEVSIGDCIGTVGNSGYSTGAHLHFEITVGGSRVDPMTQGDLGTLLEENEGG